MIQTTQLQNQKVVLVHSNGAPRTRSSYDTPARTCLGLSWVVLSPWPSRPYSPSPHVYTSPLEMMAAL